LRCRFAQHNSDTQLSPRDRRRLAAVLIAATAALIALVIFGAIVERRARTPLIQVGQPAPDWTLPSASGGSESLAAQRGHRVVLAFVPSVNCDICAQQLRALQSALSALRARGTAAFAISTDLPAVQRSYSARLGLGYPLLSEAPAFGLHPVGSAYGVYHGASNQAGPVDINAIVVLDVAGTVRAVSVLPNQAISAAQLVDLVEAAGRAQ
jgi:thioredoxin-dependent peroxiredoxin